MWIRNTTHFVALSDRLQWFCRLCRLNHKPCWYEIALWRSMILMVDHHLPIIFSGYTMVYPMIFRPMAESASKYPATSNVFHVGELPCLQLHHDQREIPARGYVTHMLYRLSLTDCNFNIYSLLISDWIMGKSSQQYLIYCIYSICFNV